MSPEEKKYCDHHFALIKSQGTTERALMDIDKKLDKLFDIAEKRTDIDNAQDKEINNLSGFLKAYMFHITVALSLLSIAIKLWSK